MEKEIPVFSKDLQKTAKKGDAIAERNLGLCYYYGNGIKQDKKEGFKWLLYAALENDPIATYYLGRIHEKDGDFTTANNSYIATMIGKADSHKAWEFSRFYKVYDIKLGPAYRSYKAIYKASNYDIATHLYDMAEKSNNVEVLMLRADNYPGSMKAIEYYTKAAELGSSEAQYLMGYFYLDGKVVSKNLVKARMWIDKSLAQNNPEAKTLLNELIEAERQDSIAQVQREEAERQRQAEIERQRQMTLQRQREQQRQDSIDYAQGRKKAPYSYIIRNATTISEPDEKFKYLCAGNMSAFFGKGNLDGLDMAAYKQSPQYQTDRQEFERQRNKVYAVTKAFHSCALDVRFEADGIKIQPTYFGYSTFAGNYMDMGQLFGERFLIPLTINANKGVLYFKSTDLQALLKVKNSYNSHTAQLVILCKPSMLKDCIMPGSRELQTNASRRSFCVVDPIAMYIVDSSSDEVLLDLSKYVKSISKPAARQQFEAQIKNNNAAANRSSYKKTYHKTPRQTTCPYCLGKGFWVDWEGTPREERKRCTNCYGRGYVLEHNY